MTTVKPLNWEEDRGFWKAQTNLIACYSVWDCGDHWECSLLDGQFPSAEAAKSAAFADYSARIMSAIEPADVGVETVRHKKRGTTYEVIGVGKMQAEHWIEQKWTHEPQSGSPPSATWSRVDMREVAIYRSTDDGQIWVRPVEEFNDGRFERAALKGDEQ